MRASQTWLIFSSDYAGIGRQARLRAWCPQGRGSSTLPSRIKAVFSQDIYEEIWLLKEITVITS